MSGEVVPGLQSMRVPIAGRHLGLPGSPETLLQHLGALTAADVVQTAAKILLWLEAPGRDAFGAGQRELLSNLFPQQVAGPLLRAMDLGPDSEEGFDVVFHPGQLLALQKLGSCVGKPGPPNSFDNGSSVLRFLIAAAQVNDVRDQLVGEGNVDDEMGGAIYGFRAAEQNRITYPIAVAGRAFRLWLDSQVPWPSGIEHPDDYCRHRFGVGLHRFVAIAAAPAIGRFELDLNDPGAAPFNPPEYFAQSEVGVDTAAAVLRELTYAPRLGDSSVVGEPGEYWSFFDVADRPLMPCGTGIVVPCSLRYSLDRATTGLFWMLHAANAGNVGPLTTHFGRMFENYCLRASEGLRSPTTAISGDFTYARGTKKTSDVLITGLGRGRVPVRIFVECGAMRPRASVFMTGNRADFDDYVEALMGKLAQLDRVITDHQAGAFRIPNDLAGPNDAALPVLVVDSPFHWTFTLRNVLDAPQHSSWSG
jgi:hypothetical protein